MPCSQWCSWSAGAQGGGVHARARGGGDETTRGSRVKLMVVLREKSRKLGGREQICRRRRLWSTFWYKFSTRLPASCPMSTIGLPKRPKGGTYS
jgi:hypothetical protein